MIEAIFERRSIRKFEDKIVESEKIDLLMKAAMYAPSGHNRQPYQFIVCDDQKVIDDLHNLHAASPALKEAKLCIVVCGYEGESPAEKTYYLDCAAATQNILLEAYDLGLGTCWMGINKSTEHLFIDYFKLPENIHPINLIAVGYPAESRPRPERYKAEKVHYNQW